MRKLGERGNRKSFVLYSLHVRTLPSLLLLWQYLIKTANSWHQKESTSASSVTYFSVLAKLEGEEVHGMKQSGTLVFKTARTGEKEKGGESRSSPAGVGEERSAAPASQRGHCSSRAREGSQGQARLDAEVFYRQLSDPARLCDTNNPCPPSPPSSPGSEHRDSTGATSLLPLPPTAAWSRPNEQQSTSKSQKFG